MALVDYLPLVLACVVAAPAALTLVSPRVDRVVTRLAMATFRDFVDTESTRRIRRTESLRAAQFPETYKEYAATTWLYAIAGVLAGSLAGLYLVWASLIALSLDPESVRSALPESLWFLTEVVGLSDISLTSLFLLLLASSLTAGVVSGAGVYYSRWLYAKQVASARRRRIDASLPRTVAFIYALSRSGMPFPAVMRILSDHRDVYGASAEEVGVAVRNMDLFNVDMISAIRSMARRTPSEQFKEFSENLASVLQSGRSLSDFLRKQYEEFQEEAEAQQQQVLELLTALAEVYVTVFVAGPLFMITILVVIAIAAGDTLPLLRATVYVLLPLGNVAFILYLDSVTGTFGRSEVSRPAEGVPVDLSDLRRADGGVQGRHPNEERLALYQRITWARERLGSPIESVIERPQRILWVTVPLAVAVTVLRLPAATVDGTLSVQALDDLVVQASLFVLGTFAIVYELHRQRLKAIERAVPDLLDRLASVNEAGMTVVESIRRVRQSDLGALDDEIDRVWADIQWGADVETALRRFERRVRTTTVSRIVTLITQAMNASGDLATVLRIAASQAKADRRLKRQRRQEMVTYLLVVYISFGVFLLIVGALSTVLLPSLPDGSVIANATNASGSGGRPPAALDSVANIGSLNEQAFTTVFFHTALLQGALSGFVGGQMSTGDIRDGAKHATIMVAAAYAAFILML